ncbi:hypothetical protein AB6A40_004743 [Gnathostoma spinigerum]|uniref:Fibroblast growth factor n=1 Tax=Gnathostoma spinigerum TaxID=75299 RepID=A0ABD6EL35_9BILA
MSFVRTRAYGSHLERKHWCGYSKYIFLKGILEFMSVAFGLVSIRGRESQRYLCMDREGRLYGAVKQNYSSECVFMEEMLENYYNLYSSCSYGTRKKPWYIALRKTGRPRKGKNSRKRRKSSHFLVVHFDGGRFPSRTYTDYTRESTGNADVQSTNRLPSRAYRYGYGDDASLFYRSKQHHSPPPPLPPPPKPRSLSEILTGTLNNDHSAIHTAQRSMPTLGFVRRTPQRNSDTVGGRDLTVEERKSNRRKRGRKARLEREERQRQRRRLELELKRANPLHERRTQEGRQQSSRQRKERSFSGT